MGAVANKNPNPGMPQGVRQQYGVLPYRETKNAGLEFLLVISRETRRWIVPKGWPTGIEAGRGGGGTRSHREPLA